MIEGELRGHGLTDDECTRRAKIPHQEQLQSAPVFIRQLAEQLGRVLPRLESPSAAGGIILFVLLIPLGTLLRRRLGPAE